MGNRVSQVKLPDRSDIRKIFLTDTNESKTNESITDEAKRDDSRTKKIKQLVDMVTQKRKDNLHRVCNKLAPMIKPYKQLLNRINLHDHRKCTEETTGIFCEVTCMKQTIFNTDVVFPEDNMGLSVENGFGSDIFENAILKLLIKECTENLHYVDLFDKCPGFIAFALCNEILSVMLKTTPVNIFDEIEWPDNKITAFVIELKDNVGLNIDCSVVMGYLTIRYIRRLVLTLYTMDFHKAIEKIFNKYNEMVDNTYL